jgi:hypothetical protein
MRFVVIIFLLFPFLVSAVDISYSESEVVFSGKWQDPIITRKTIAERQYDQIRVDGCESTLVDGYELPVFSKLINLPATGNFKLSLLETDMNSIALGNPLAPLSFEFEPDFDSPFWFPQNPVLIGKPVIMRGDRFVQISIFPVQYNPAENSIKYITDLELVFQLDTTDPENPKTKANSSLPFEKKNIIGYEQREQSYGGSYLIIAPQNCTSILQPLMQWKEKLGYKTKLTVLEEIGSTNTDIKNYLQNAYDNWQIPPEYVILVGDVDGAYQLPSFFIEGYLYPWCVTDHPYTLLEGDDYFPDIMIGRLSVRNEMQLATIITKIINYESNPYIQSDWIKSALMVGYVDSWNGFSQRETLMVIRNKLLQFEYTKVDTFISPWQFGQSLLKSEINNGHSFICYRGAGHSTYWSGGSSGQMLTSTNVLELENGFMLPFVTSMTCGGGDFAAAEAPSCFGETWLSAGTPSLPKGAIGFIGPSERDTKAWFNNANAMGIYQGLTQENIFTGAGLLLRGKMELYQNFPFGHEMGSALNSDQFYFFVYNLLGDPGLRLWTDTPKNLQLEVDDYFLGSNYLSAQISTDGDLQGFAVSITSQDSLINSGFTDSNGNIVLPVVLSEGTYHLTASRYGYIPQTITFEVQPADILSLSGFELSADPIAGEMISIAARITNLASIDAVDIQIELSPQNYFSTVLSNSQSIDLLPSQQNAVVSFDVEIEYFWDNQKNLDFLLVINSNLGENIALIPLQVFSPQIIYGGYLVQNETGCLVQGESAEFYLTLENTGNIASSNFSAQLTCLNSIIQFENTIAEFDPIQPQTTLQNSAPFRLTPSASVITGAAAKFLVELTNDDIVLEEFTIDIPVGIIAETSPTFSTSSYLAIESRDSGNFFAPTYLWHEIDPQYGGDGILVTPDHVIQDGFSALVPLPFQFRYYGSYYDEITICSEGYLTMGDNDQIFFRNRFIPSGVGPAAMLAPFWDSLANGQIFVYHDILENRFIIQWSDWQSTYNPNYSNTFQVILLNPQYYGTSGQDSEFIFQYKEIHNIDAGDHYATIGIENETQTEGILLTFANMNVPTFHPVENNTAILFTVNSSPDFPFLAVNESEINLTTHQDTLIHFPLLISNESSQNSEVSYQISFSHFSRNYRVKEQLRSLENDLILQLSGSYIPNQTINMPFYLLHLSPDAEGIRGISLDFPQGCIIISAENIGDLQWNGESGNGASVSWGFDGTIFSPTIPQLFMIDLFIEINMPPPLNIDWYIEGDGSGAPPHFASGTISLPATNDNLLWVSYPNGGESIVPGLQDSIRWNHFGNIEEVKIELSRDNGNNWESVTEAAPNINYFPHLFSGPLSDNCLLKISSINDECFDISDEKFQISAFNFLYPTSTTVMSYETADSLIWSDNGEMESVDIYLSLDSGFTWQLFAASIPNTGIHHFTVPGPPSNHCQFKIRNEFLNVENKSVFFQIADTPVNWLSADSMQGTILAGEVEEVIISIDPTNLEVGFYTAYIGIRSSTGQLIHIPISLEVIETIPPISNPILYQNYPNPFSPTTASRSPFTRIDYEVSEYNLVKIDIFNSRGQHIKNLQNEYLPLGRYHVYWNGSDKNNKKAASGVYYYLLRTGDYQKAKKLTIIK